MTLSRTSDTPNGPGSIALVALLALALRIAVSLAIGFNPAFFDADAYHRLAMEGVAGRSVPTDGHPPGYSWLLMVIYGIAGSDPRIVYAIQIALSAAGVFLMGDAARRRFGPRGGLLTAALLAVSGTLAIYPSLLLSENLCLLGVALIGWILLPPLPDVGEARLLACAGIVGVLALTRTGMICLAVPLVALPFLAALREKPARNLALSTLMLVIAVAPLLAYSLHRAKHTGVFRVGSPADVYSFYLGNNPEATGRAEPFRDLPRPGTVEAPDMEAVAQILGPKARAYMLTHPFREGELFLRRASLNLASNKKDLLYLYGNGWAGEHSPGAVRAVYVWVAISVPLLGAAVLLAFARDWRDGAFRFALLLTFLGLLPYQISIGDARYLIPFHPLLAFAAGGLLAPHKAGLWATRTRLAAALLAIAFLSNAAYDLRATDAALRKIARPGGSLLAPSYDFAR
jgi:hypothetical protein